MFLARKYAGFTFLSTIVLGGCAAIGQPAAVPTAPASATATSPLIRFVSEEGPGAQTVVADQDGSVLYVAVIDRDYNAASGRRCKRVTFDDRKGGRGAARGSYQRVACFHRDGWLFTAPLLDDGGPSQEMLN